MQKARRIPLPWLPMGRRKLNFSTPPCFLIYYMWRLRHCLLQEETLKDESPPNMPISYPLYPAFFFAISPFFYLLFLFYSLKDKKLPGNDGSVYSFSSPEQAAVTQPNTTFSVKSVTVLVLTWSGTPLPHSSGFLQTPEWDSDGELSPWVGDYWN